eukprot:1646338-Rhodomonas_salina.2
MGAKGLGHRDLAAPHEILAHVPPLHWSAMQKIRGSEPAHSRSTTPHSAARTPILIFAFGFFGEQDFAQTSDQEQEQEQDQEAAVFLLGV